MGSYKNNKDGTGTVISTNIQVVDAPMEEFLSRGEFNAVTPNDVSVQNKLVAENEVTKAVDTMPTASSSLVGTIVQYVGTTSGGYTNGYFYKCVSDGEVSPTYYWEELTINGELVKAIVCVNSLPVATSDQLGDVVMYMGNNYIYQCVSDGQIPATYSWQRIDVQPNGGISPQNGTAIVIGDSYFINEPTYSFADYLENQNIYETIYDYAMGGTGWGVCHNGEYPALITRLQDQQMRTDIAASDVMYLHLGGNDILSILLSTATETDLLKKIVDALNEIYTINPNILIYYVPAFDTKAMVSDFWLRAVHGTPVVIGQNIINVNKEMAGKMLISQFFMDIALTVSDLKIMELNSTSFDLITRTITGDIHPTADAAEEMFNRIIHDDYAIPRIRSYVTDNTNMYLVSSIAQTFFPTALAKVISDNKFDFTDDDYIIFDFDSSGTTTYAHTIMQKTSTDVYYNDLLNVGFDYNRDTLIINKLNPYTGEYNNKDFDLAHIGSIQVETLPTASASELSKVYQYIGTSTESYIHGFFYTCVSDGDDPATYSWQQINVQPSTSGGGIYDDADWVNLTPADGVTVDSAKIRRIGNIVFLELDNVTGTVNSTYFNPLKESLPEKYRPSVKISQNIVVNISGGSNTITLGKIMLSTGGVFRINMPFWTSGNIPFRYAGIVMSWCVAGNWDGSTTRYDDSNYVSLTLENDVTGTLSIRRLGNMVYVKGDNIACTTSSNVKSILSTNLVNKYLPDITYCSNFVATTNVDNLLFTNVEINANGTINIITPLTSSADVSRLSFSVCYCAADTIV